MSFDQTAEREAVEAEMKDTCLITRDPEQETDDVLNEGSLILEPVPTDRTTIYSGKCSVSGYVRDENRDEGQREDTRQLWHSSVPISASLPKYGDHFKVTAVREGGDPLLVNKEFTVIRVVGHTQGVRRPLVLQDALGETVR